MRITALAGGIGGARFLRGLRDDLAGDPTYGPDGSDPAEITVVGNTADDITLFGLRVCPDLDTLMYTLGGGIHEEQGWGRAEETFAVKGELAAYGLEPQWFGLGDRDVATHVVRTLMLDQGYPLSQVTEALCARWEPGVRLLPMSDDRVETHVVIEDEDGPPGDPLPGVVGTAARRPSLPLQFVPVGAERRQAGPGGPRGARRRRRRPAPAVQPGGLDRHDPRRARRAGRPRRHLRPGRRGVPDRRRGARPRHGRRLPDRPGHRDVRTRRGRPLHRAARRLARLRRRTPRPWCRTSRCSPGPCSWWTPPPRGPSRARPSTSRSRCAAPREHGHGRRRRGAPRGGGRRPTSRRSSRSTYPHLSDGAIVVVTSKVVSKAEGRSLAADDRSAAIDVRDRPRARDTGGHPDRRDPAGAGARRCRRRRLQHPGRDRAPAPRGPGRLGPSPAGRAPAASGGTGRRGGQRHRRAGRGGWG